MKRIKAEPEYTVIGGLLRWSRMKATFEAQLGLAVNVAAGDMMQFTSALGAAILGHRRLEKLQAEGRVATG